MFPHSYKCSVDTMAFMGLRVNDSCLSFHRAIPWGDMILESRQVGDFTAYRTHSGYFLKYKNNPIEESNEYIFNALKSCIYSLDFLNDEPKIAFKELNLRYPQAGLTRGSKRTFSTKINRRVTMSKFSFTPSLFDNDSDVIEVVSEKKVVTSFQISKKDHKRLCDVAAYQGVSVSELIRESLNQTIFKKKGY